MSQGGEEAASPAALSEVPEEASVIELDEALEAAVDGTFEAFAATLDAGEEDGDEEREAEEAADQFAEAFATFKEAKRKLAEKHKQRGYHPPSGSAS